MDSITAIAQKLETLVGSAGVQSWEQVETTLQQQITRAIAPDSLPPCVVFPSTQEELATVVSCAHEQGWRVLPCGGGSKLHWGGLAEGIQIVISTARLNRIIDHAVGDLTVTLEAGVRFTDLQATLAQAQQFLALDPPYAETATMGGIIATASAGSLRHRYNSVRDMLLGISFVRADGQIVKAGGRVVKNVAGYDLMKLLTGSFGTLGIVVQGTFRAYPQPESSQTVVLTGDPGAIAQATCKLFSSTLTPTAVDLLSTQVVSDLELGQGFGLLVRFQSLPVSVEEQCDRLVSIAQTLALQSTVYSAASESALWQQFRERIQNPLPDRVVACKMGVVSAEAVTALTKVNHLVPQGWSGVIHAGKGLGILQFDSEAVTPQALSEVRSQLGTLGGFLSVLAAPVAFKQQIDIWGYTGDALGVMHRLKEQFDPAYLLSPHRFVNGI